MTDELIHKLKEAATDEERKAILEASGEQLTEEELAAVAVGCSDKSPIRQYSP